MDRRLGGDLRVRAPAAARRCRGRHRRSLIRGGLTALRRRACTRQPSSALHAKGIRTRDFHTKDFRAKAFRAKGVAFEDYILAGVGYYSQYVDAGASPLPRL